MRRMFVRVSRWLPILFLLIFLQSTYSLDVAFSPSLSPKYTILKELKKARSRIDVFMFIFTDEDYASALCYLMTKKKVKVNLLVDETYTKDTPIFKRLVSCGAKVSREKFPGSLHTKYCIIDGKTLLTGSFNWTISATRHNYEDLLIIRKQSIIDKYVKWSKRLLARNKEKFEYPTKEKISITNYPVLRKLEREDRKLLRRNFSFQDMNVYFTQKEYVKDIIIKDIEDSKRRIDLAMFLLSDDKVLNALKKKKKENPSFVVNMLVGETEHRKIAEKLLAKYGFYPVFSFGKNGEGCMHLKVAIFDEKILWTGSANWTYAGLTQNAEDNIRIVSPSLAKYYLNFIKNEILQQKSKAYSLYPPR